MNKKNTNYLLKKYSWIYREYHLPCSQTCLCWGFACGDGWYKLLKDLSEKIDKHLKKNPELKKNFAVVQVKEKFATLRYYVHGSDETIDKYVDEAEALSAVTCEDCGKPGKPRDTSWKSTLCDNCLKKHDKDYN